MISRALAHTQPSVIVNVTVVVNADKALLFVAGLVWLAWLHLARIARFIGGVLSWLGAAGRVIRRRWRNWRNRTARRIRWEFSGLVYGPVMGVG